MPTELQLSSVLSEFARTMVTDFPIQGILDHLVERIVAILPITGAGVTLISSETKPRYVAASDDAALRFEKLQTELREGPCLLAYESGQAVAVADLRAEARFPTFVPRALEAGLAAVFTFPLHHGAERLGALDLYRDVAGSLDTSTMDAAQTLADVAAAYLLNAQARTDLKNSSDRSRDDALRDPLTGLPNRTLFLERLDHAVLRARRSGKTTAVLYADLDRFKLVNDVHGHAIGDELLVAVGQRLGSVLRPGDTLARMSGDEFVILCEDLDDATPVEAIVERAENALRQPFKLSGATVNISATVGIGLSGRGDQAPEPLLRDADEAMYEAKREGDDGQRVIASRERLVVSSDRSLEEDLRGAAERGEMRTEYQPIVNTDNGRIASAEALLRWAHPTRGLLAPAVFLPVAERAGLMREVGRWVLERACADLNRMPNWFPSYDLSMSVNVSPQEFTHAGFRATVADVLDNAGTHPDRVTLELTEAAIERDPEQAVGLLAALKLLGVNLAIDGFGNGDASLSYLRRFPIDTVKLSAGFVAGISQSASAHDDASEILELAHRLEIRVVAKGVETQDQRESLLALGCEFCQGYYFAHPMSAREFDALLEPRPDGRWVHLPDGTAH